MAAHKTVMFQDLSKVKASKVEGWKGIHSRAGRATLWGESSDLMSIKDLKPEMGEIARVCCIEGWRQIMKMNYSSTFSVYYVEEKMLFLLILLPYSGIDYGMLILWMNISQYPERRTIFYNKICSSWFHYLRWLLYLVFLLHFM